MSFLEYAGTHPRAKWGISPSHPSPSFSGEARKKCFHLNFNLPWSFSDTFIAHEEEQFLSGWAGAAHFLLHIFSSSSRIYLPQFSIDAGYLLLNQQGDKLFNRQAKTTDSGEQRDNEKAGSGHLRRKITIFLCFVLFCFFISHSFSCPQLVRMTPFLLTPSPAEIVAILSSRPSVNTCLNMLQICVHFI